jgi:hypothetical protein
MKMEINKDGLITDNGKIRNCNANVLKMGIFKTAYILYPYRVILRDLDYKKIIEAIKTFFQLILLIFIFPVSPIICAIERYIRAKKDQQINSRNLKK